jgi:predicted metal-dependent phosphotriesterase family hydrolase
MNYYSSGFPPGRAGFPYLDAGWYDPARPDGIPESGYRGYTALTRNFIPALLEHGVSEFQVHQITVDNPATAFAFS